MFFHCIFVIDREFFFKTTSMCVCAHTVQRLLNVEPRKTDDYQSPVVIKKYIPRGKKKGRSFAGGLFQGHWSVDRCQKRPITVKETHYSVKRDLYTIPRPLVCRSRVRKGRTLSKETHYSVKRDPLQCQKRPITVSKETHYSVKRDPLQCQKRPITVSKETYILCVKGEV